MLKRLSELKHQQQRLVAASMLSKIVIAEKIASEFIAILEQLIIQTEELERMVRGARK